MKFLPSEVIIETVSLLAVKKKILYRFIQSFYNKYSLKNWVGLFSTVIVPWNLASRCLSNNFYGKFDFKIVAQRKGYD